MSSKLDNAWWSATRLEGRRCGAGPLEYRLVTEILVAGPYGSRRVTPQTAWLSEKEMRALLLLDGWTRNTITARMDRVIKDGVSHEL